MSVRTPRFVPSAELFGPPKVRLRTGWTEFGSDNRWLLLAYLAHRGDGVGRDRLASLFWSDVPTSLARERFRQLLRRTRGIVGSAGLEADRRRVRWRVDADVHAFDVALTQGDADRALDLYKGPLLDGLEADAAPEVATWLDLERATWHRRWRDLVLERAASDDAELRVPRALDRLEAVLRADPLDEEALQAYMSLAHRTGSRRRALDAYRTFAERVRAELDLEPSAATRRLADAVRSREPEATIPIHLPAGRPPDAPAAAAPANAFVGRDVELLDVVHLLNRSDCRMVTLVGMGGVGKSRIAHQVQAQWPDPAYFVRLDGLADPHDIPAAIGVALGRSPSATGDPLDRVIAAIGTRSALLVLDDYEHLTEGAALTTQLLRSCPALSILVTSRERLGVPEEWIFEVPGLAVPPPELPLERALAYDAVRLFAARAEQVRDGYRPTESDLPHVVRICRSVQGLPLGLELAAAWMRSLPAEAIADEIAADVDFLQRRRGTDRHRSVRAVFERSWRSLSPEERRVLATASVFRDGFARDAAGIVAGASTPLLAALVDRSLLRSLEDGRSDRHPLLYQYLREKHASFGDERATHERHARYFVALAEDVGSRLRTARGVDDLNALENDHENFRTALRWGSEHEPDLALRLAGALGRFWEIRGHLVEGCAWLETCLANAADPPAEVEGRARDALGRLTSLRGDRAAAATQVQAALACWRRIGDDRGIASALNHLGGLALEEGAYDRAEALYAEALASCRAREDRTGEAYLHNNLGEVARLRGDPAVAEAAYREALATHRATGNQRGAGITLGNLGFVVRRQGRHEEAAAAFAESIAIKHRIGDEIGLAYGCIGLAGVLSDGGAFADAARLLGVAERLIARQAVELDAADRADHRATLELCAARLGRAAFETALDEGRALHLEAVVARAARIARGEEATRTT